MKTCTKCNIFKNLGDFRKDKKSSMGRRNICKSCDIISLKRKNRHEIRNHKYLLELSFNNLIYFNVIRATNNPLFSVLEYNNKIEKLNDLFSPLLQTIVLLTAQISIHVSFEIDFVLRNKNDIEFIASKRTNKYIFNEEKQIDNIIYTILEKIETLVYESEYQESGLIFQSFSNFRLYINPYIITSGGTYIDLPKKIKESQACINIHNNDNKCFLWCIIAYFHLKKNKVSNPSKVYVYKKSIYNELINDKNITYPTPINKIKQFENDNDLTINLYRLSEIYDDGQIKYPISLVYPDTNDYRIINEDRHINLLLFKHHYILIKNINRLFTHSIKGNNTAFVCIWCGVNYFTRKSTLDNHVNKCKFKYEKQKYNLPSNKYVEFNNFHKEFFVPFVIYSDFESYLDTSSNKSNTDKISYNNRHLPLAFAFKTICNIDSKFNSELVYYIGKECDIVFIDYILTELERIDSIIKSNLLIKKTMDKRLKKMILTVPIVFHNLEGYDLHLFIDQVSKKSKTLNAIPKSKEKYLALDVTFNKLRLKIKFIDSLHFITGSLSDNAKKLTKFKYCDPNLTTKQFFPYNLLTNLDSINLKMEYVLSSKEFWYNTIKKEHITDEDFNYAKSISIKYNCKTLGDYTLLYLKTDVLLLTDIFENFRTLSMNTYQLDPACYYTTPGLAWDAALKYTKAKLELLTDREMIDFFIEKGSLRGGISTVSSKKYVKANNKYLDNYDENKPSTFIMYFDVTNLYGYTMCDKLPTGNFKWLNLAIYDQFYDLQFLKTLLNNNTGYILEVDLIYPVSLKNIHCDLPLAPNHLNNKLSPNLYSKYNYRLHINNLVFYLENGLLLGKIHKILSFDQSEWLKSYIMLNTELRKSSNDESAKNFYKLMNNAVYGKTMENVFMRKNYKFIGTNDFYKTLKLTKSEKFKNEFFITPNLTILELEKKEIIFDKPIYIGFSILELSKLHMYKLHYDLFKKNFQTFCTLLYMDTDSLIYEFVTDDIYSFIYNNKNSFDLSAYPSTFQYYSPENKGILGTLKDEYSICNNNLNLITEFVCLKSKCYSLKLLNKEEIKKCKGISYVEVKKLLFDTYYNYLFNNMSLTVEQNQFRSHLHSIYSITSIKTALNNQDDKRINLDYIKTVPHGYFKLNNFD